MRPEYATPEDFATWEERAKTMTTACLAYTVRDCQQAAEAMRGWNPVKEGFYSDQASTYGMELTRRRRDFAMNSYQFYVQSLPQFITDNDADWSMVYDWMENMCGELTDAQWDEVGEVYKEFMNDTRY